MNVKLSLEKSEGPNCPRWKKLILLLKYYAVPGIVSGEVICPTNEETEINKAKKTDSVAQQVIFVANMNDSNVVITATCN